jgi:hypothetical protein
MGLTVITTGGRDYQNRKRIAAILSWLNPSLVVHGANPDGADSIVAEAASRMMVRHVPMRAEWQRYGRAAGPIRNAAMLREFPKALLVAFHGGKGTTDAVREALKTGRSVLLVDGGPRSICDALLQNEELHQFSDHQGSVINQLRSQIASLQERLDSARDSLAEGDERFEIAFQQAKKALGEALYGEGSEEWESIPLTDLAFSAARAMKSMEASMDGGEE